MDSFEEVFQIYTSMMKRRSFVDLQDLLVKARKEASSKGKRNLAGSIGELLASVYLAIGENDSALQAFLRAKEDDPRNLFLRLRIATFLFSVMGRPSDALTEIDPILSSLLETREIRHATLGVVGAIYASLGRSSEALDCLTQMLYDDSIQGMSSSSLDFFLVESLASHGLALEECRRYLEIALAAANRDGDQRVADRARSALERLR